MAQTILTRLLRRRAPAGASVSANAITVDIESITVGAEAITVGT